MICLIIYDIKYINCNIPMGSMALNIMGTNVFDLVNKGRQIFGGVRFLGFVVLWMLYYV